MDYLNIIINAIISIIVAGITGYFSAKITFKVEIKRKIYTEREETYIELFKLVDQLRHNPYLVFNSNDFLCPFKEVKARLNLYASRDVHNIITPLNEIILDISSKYFELFDSPEALSVKEARIEHDGVTEAELQQEEELYLDQNVIDKSFVEKVLIDLIAKIRQELKIK